MKLSSILGSAVLLTASLAMAAPVSYTTTGIFGASGTNVLVSGNSTLTFTGAPNENVDTTVSNSFGSFQLTGGSPGSGSLNPFNSSFTLTFNQTVPTGGTASDTGTVIGNVSADSGVLTYNPGPAVSIGSVTYTFSDSYLLQVPAGVGGGGGNTVINGVITGGAVVPEPSTFVLLGAGISALAIMRRKRAA
jgi:hypothetical protein